MAVSAMLRVCAVIVSICAGRANVLGSRFAPPPEHMAWALRQHLAAIEEYRGLSYHASFLEVF